MCSIATLTVFWRCHRESQNKEMCQVIIRVYFLGIFVLISCVLTLPELNSKAFFVDTFVGFQLIVFKTK